MRVQLFTLLAVLLAAPSWGYVAERLKPNQLPVEFDNQLFSKQLSEIPAFAGDVVAGPFIREGRWGNLYLSGSIMPRDGSPAKCFYGSFRFNGTSLKSGILDPSNEFLPDGPCIMFGAARALDGTTYHLGTRNGAPYVAKLNNDMSIVDTDFLVLHRDTLATLTSGKVINGGAIALNQVTGEVYSAWNFDDNTVTILKYAPSTKSISLFTSTPAGANTKVSSLYVLPNGVLMTVGITLNRFDRDGLPSAGKASAFAGWWVDPRDGSSGKLQDIKVWVLSNPVTDISISVDDQDYSVYMAISFENAASQVYKLAPVVPKLNVNLPLTQIEIPGKFTSSIANFPESFAFIATTIDGVGNVIYVTDSTLTQKSTLKLPRTAAGEKFVSFVACKREVGTVFIVSTDSSNNLVLRKAGNKVNRVRIFHRKTGLVVTMALDSKVILFPLDETTKNQQFDRSLFTNTFRNVQLDRALTTRGRPFRYSTYEQERGFKLIGEPYRQENRFQRFAFSNGRIISLKDKKCLGIDRNFLVNGRWPRTFTGLPLITVPCSTDKLQVFDIARAI